MSSQASAVQLSLIRLCTLIRRGYDVHLLAAAPTGGLVGGQLLLHTGRLVHLLWVKGHAAEWAEGRGHLEAWLQTLPTETGEREGKC